jgi:hypothetical protein
MYYIKKIKLEEEQIKNNIETENNYNKLISDNKKIDFFYKILIIILFVGITSVLLYIGDNLLNYAPLELWVGTFITTCLILLYFINKE